jgi:hypothetical protein
VTVATESIGGQLQTTDVHVPHVFFWVLQQALPNVRMPHVPEHPEHPLAPLLEPELLEPELLPLVGTQSLPEHVSVDKHAMHGLPPDWHAEFVLPGWQVPLVSQHPLQVDAHEGGPLSSPPLLLPPASLPASSSPVSSVASSPPDDPDEGIVASSLPDDPP